MSVFAVIFLLAFLLTIIFLFWNFPWLARYYKPKYCSVKANCKKIFIASDLHLLPDVSLPKKLVSAVSRENADCVVFLGDLLDYRKKATEEELKVILEKALQPILSIEDSKYIYYTPSTSSHDPKLDEFVVFSLDDKKIFICPGILILESGDKRMYFAHGDYACRHGTIARLLNKIMAIFGYKMFTERLAKRAYGVPKESWLFVGHTHMVGIDDTRKVANPGSWKSKIGVSSSETYILVIGDNIYIEG